MTVYNRLRNRTLKAILMAAAAWSLGQPAAAQESNVPMPRVRSSDPAIAALIEQALIHSPTFKRLVATIDASNGIVYVQSGPCPGGIVACLPIWMTSSGGNRFMRIVVDRKRIQSDCQLL